MDDGWVETENPNNTLAKDDKNKGEAMDIDDMEEENVIGGEEKQEEAVDIDDIDNNEAGNTNIFATGKYVVMNEPDENIQKVRSYDLSVTYDFFYQTPRLWLLGYSEEG